MVWIHRKGLRWIRVDRMTKSVSRSFLLHPMKFLSRRQNQGIAPPLRNCGSDTHAPHLQRSIESLKPSRCRRPDSGCVDESLCSSQDFRWEGHIFDLAHAYCDNSVLMTLRRRQSHPETPMEITDGETWRNWKIADQTKDVERHYLKRESADRLGRAISDLKPHSRTVIEIQHRRMGG
jgi:hypothetical protein